MWTIRLFHLLRLVIVSLSLTEEYAYAMKAEFTNAASVQTNPNFVYGALFGGMCRAFNVISNLSTIKNDTDNLSVCIDFVYEESGSTNDILDVGEFVTALIGFRSI